MKYMTIALAIILCFASFSFAAFDGGSKDARTAAFSDMPSELGTGAFSLFGEEDYSAAAGYRITYGEGDFSDMAFAASYNLKKAGRFGLNFSTFSVADMTNETEFNLAFTRTMLNDMHTDSRYQSGRHVFAIL
jgi:hypothetical protein